MKIPPERDDELLKSFLEEAASLPRAAAAHARSRQRARAITVRFATTLGVTLLIGALWFSERALRHAVEEEIAKPATSSEDSKTPARQGYVKIHQPGEAIQSNPVPSDASERERTLLTQLPGVPLLIVKNDVGEITRIHIFEK